MNATKMLYCMGGEDHYGCIHRTKYCKCDGEIGICPGQSCLPKQETVPPMPETAPRKAEDVYCETCNDTTIGKIIEEMSHTLTIHCDRIVLQQNGISINMNVPNGFDKIDTIVINGVKFTKDL